MRVWNQTPLRSLFRSFASLIAVAAAMSAPAQAAPLELIAGWDFQTTTTGGTAVAVSPNTPNLYQANVGTGTFYLNGAEGSSNWSAATELNAFTGTNVNATNGLTTVTTSPAALALLGGTGQSANGKSAVFKFSTLGKSQINVSLAAQRTATGFTSQNWSYSTDGSNYVSFATLSSGTTAGTLTSSFVNSGVLTLPTLPSLFDNLSSAWIKVTFTGSTSAAGNNRIDNIQFMAVPEPGTYVLAALGLAVAALASKKSRRVGQSFRASVRS